jgi:hypothetical protein
VEQGIPSHNSKTDESNVKFGCRVTASAGRSLGLGFGVSHWTVSFYCIHWIRMIKYATTGGEENAIAVISATDTHLRLSREKSIRKFEARYIIHNLI